MQHESQNETPGSARCTGRLDYSSPHREAGEVHTSKRVATSRRSASSAGSSGKLASSADSAAGVVPPPLKSCSASSMLCSEPRPSNSPVVRCSDSRWRKGSHPCRRDEILRAARKGSYNALLDLNTSNSMGIGRTITAPPGTISRQHSKNIATMADVRTVSPDWNLASGGCGCSCSSLTGLGGLEVYATACT